MKIPTWNDRALVTRSADASSSTTDVKRPTSQHQHPQLNKPKKSVGFANYMVVFEIPTRSEYTPEEHGASWYSGADYDAFDQRDYRLLDQLDATGSIVHPEEDSARGLEGHTREASVVRRNLRYQATAAVMNEQYRQRYYGVCDDECLAREYHAVAWHSQYTSYTQGMVDEQDAIQQDQKLQLPILCARRVSDCKNVLRNVISIERGDSMMQDEETFPTVSNTKCIQGNPAAEDPLDDFMVHTFFQDLYISAAAE